MTGFQETPVWLAAVVLGGMMLVGWRTGIVHGRKMAVRFDDPGEKTFADASLALLGLLLAFCFSLALDKFNQRRQMVVTDSNAIGDFYTCASLLKAPVREKLQKVIRDYAQLRLDLSLRMVSTAEFEKTVTAMYGQHAKMQELVGDAIDAGTPTVVPLVNTLNNLTSNHAARVAAIHDRLPWTIVLLLFSAATITMYVLGTHQGAEGKARLQSTVGFVAIVSLIAGVTLDLNDPGHGIMRVNQEPMRNLLATME